MERFIDRYVARLDDILFLGHLPFCGCFAKRLLLKTTPPPLDGARLRAQLRREKRAMRRRCGGGCAARVRGAALSAAPSGAAQ